MIPGMNKKQMKQMERQMKKMGMKMEDLNGVTEVIIRFEDKELIIDEPSEDTARKALEECKGDLAEAIMKLNG